VHGVGVDQRRLLADPLLDCFSAKPQQFPAFFSKVLDLAVSKDKLTMKERTWVVIFLVHCYQSIENELVRKESLRSAVCRCSRSCSHRSRLCSFPLWHALNPLRLQRELADNPAIAQRWKKFVKRQAELTKSTFLLAFIYYAYISLRKALSPLPHLLPRLPRAAAERSARQSLLPPQPPPLQLQSSMATRRPSCPA
jgi:hypothetical protein